MGYHGRKGLAKKMFSIIRSARVNRIRYRGHVGSRRLRQDTTSLCCDVCHGPAADRWPRGTAFRALLCFSGVQKRF